MIFLERGGTKVRELDELSKKILGILQNDGRKSYAAIAKEVNLSSVAVRERVLQLKADGIIEQFTTIVSARALGQRISVFFDIELEPKYLDIVVEDLRNQPEVFIIYQMTGATSLHVHAFLPDNDKLADFMKDHLYSIPGIKNINSHLLLKEYKSKLTMR